MFGYPPDGDVAVAELLVVWDGESGGVAALALRPGHVLVVGVEVVPHPRVPDPAPGAGGGVAPLAAVVVVVDLAGQGQGLSGSSLDELAFRHVLPNDLSSQAYIFVHPSFYHF